MKSGNIYNAVNPKDRPCAFNSATSAADTMHEVTRTEREQAEQRRAAMIQKVRDSIRNN